MTDTPTPTVQLVIEQIKALRRYTERDVVLRPSMTEYVNAEDLDEILEAALAASPVDNSQEIQRLRETNARLNRRCQLAEAAANLKVEEWGKRSTGHGRDYIFQLGKEAGRREVEEAASRPHPSTGDK